MGLPTFRLGSFSYSNIETPLDTRPSKETQVMEIMIGHNAYGR